MRTTLLVLLLPALALAQAEASAPRKLSVIPFATLSGEVPQRAGSKAAGMLSAELRNTDGVQVVDVKRTAQNDAHADELVAARKAVDEAKQLRQKRKFRLAEESLAKALAQYRAGAGGLADIGEVIDAQALMAAVQFVTGRDDEGQRNLAHALALAPTRELPLAKTSLLFARVVEDTRAQVAKGPKGSIQVESTPSGATVAIDGIALGNTPLLVKDVPAGPHLWKVGLVSGEVNGGVIEVFANKVAKVSAQSTAKDPEARLLAALSQNKLDQDVMSALKEHAQGHQVETLLFGALSKEGKGLALDAFAFANGEIRRLPRQSFDTELLSAGMEFYALAGKVATDPKFGEPVKVPGPVSTAVPPGGPKVAEAKYGAQAAAEAVEVEPETTPKEQGPRSPLDPSKKPLIKKK